MYREINGVWVEKWIGKIEKMFFFPQIWVKILRDC